MRLVIAKLLYIALANLVLIYFIDFVIKQMEPIKNN